MAYDGIGVNYGHHLGVLDSDEVRNDMLFLHGIGVNKVRVAMPTFTSSSAISKVREVATIAKSVGHYVIYGVTAGDGTTFDQTEWGSFKAQLPSEALWASQNGIDEFSLGNEEELHNDDVSPTDATIRSDIKSLATTIKASYSSLIVSYQTAQTHIANWNSDGIGNLDKIGFNCYGGASTFYTDVKSIVTNFGSDGYVSEFSTNDGISTYSEQQWESRIRARRNLLQELGVSSGYFFAYTDGSFGLPTDVWAIKKSDGMFRQSLNSISNKRKLII